MAAKRSYVAKTPDALAVPGMNAIVAYKQQPFTTQKAAVGGKPAYLGKAEKLAQIKARYAPGLPNGTATAAGTLTVAPLQPP